MSVDRQFGMHEIPGTEVEAPNKARQVSAGFEASMRDYIAAIWAKLGELELKVARFEDWREEMIYRLRAGPRPAPGEGEAAEPLPPSPPKPHLDKKPWEIEGLSRRTWYRRQKG